LRRPLGTKTGRWPPPTPTVSPPDLSTSLNNLSVALADLGRREDT
jgi:hypothetical protein